jgi:uncharacterized protein (DUF58 family)
MRSALRSLTFRGKALVAVGLGLGVGAAMSGQRDVLRIAVLLLALPLVSVWLATRTHFRLGADRTVSPAHVPVGSVAEATLTVTNLARRRTSTLLLREQVDPEIGDAIDRVLEHVEPGGSRATTYSLHGTQRGRFVVGPLEVTAVDPFGLARLTRAFRSTQSVLVVPRTYPLQSSADADRRGRGDSAVAALSSGGDDDIIPREYRPGDDLRRIHWRASARADDLLVRREEQPWARHVTITVDVSVDPIGGPESPVETALSMAASVAAHLLGLGWSLRLEALDGRRLVPHATGSTGQARVLETLATVAPVQAPAVELRTGSDLTVVILPAREHLLRRLPPVHHRSLAFLVDVHAWGLPGADSREALDRLRADGWHAAAITPGGITAAWEAAINDVALARVR